MLNINIFPSSSSSAIGDGGPAAGSGGAPAGRGAAAAEQAAQTEPSAVEQAPQAEQAHSGGSARRSREWPAAGHNAGGRRWRR